MKLYQRYDFYFFKNFDRILSGDNCINYKEWFFRMMDRNVYRGEGVRGRRIF